MADPGGMVLRSFADGRVWMNTCRMVELSGTVVASTTGLARLGHSAHLHHEDRSRGICCQDAGLRLTDVPNPPVSTSGRARRDEIERRRRRLLPDDLYYDDRYTADSTLWDTWLRDEHDVRRASYFAGTVLGPWRAREVRGRTRVRDLTPPPPPSPSPSPPPPPRMKVQEEARLMQRVMEDSMITHDEGQWPGLEDAMALSATGDVAILELMEEEEVMEDAPVAAFPPDLVGQQWSWSCMSRRWRT
ncbi:hypothetical protein D1007_09019 [Hordeum vulgare]|nr:hypothetical protein D1007_09019 [Hordeum vulgare]